MTQLEIELNLCKENFKFFLGYCFKSIYHDNFIFYKFHNELCDIISSIDRNDRIIINAPPRLGKTEIVKHYIAWLFLRNPASSVMYVSYDESLVMRKNREIKDLLVWLANHFSIPDLKLMKQSNGKKEWTNLANGTVIARGSNTAVTGSGCSTLLVVDDPNKPSDRTSNAVLFSRNRVFVSTIRNRINTPDVPILIIQQRISSNDLSGFLLNGGSGDNWKLYNFPAINDDGTALCPERLPLTEIENYKHDPFTYNAQYLQCPLEDLGNLFERSQLQLSNLRPPASAMKIVISVDAALKQDTHSDYNAIAVIGYKPPDFYILDVKNFHADITKLLQMTRDLRKQWGVNVPIVFEGKANGVSAVQILRKEMSGILEVNPCRNKIERALLVKFMFDSFNVHFCIRGLIWGTIQAQFLQFPHGHHDDIVDAVVQGITWLNNLPAAALSNNGVKIELDEYKRTTYQRRVYGSSRHNPTSSNAKWGRAIFQPR